MNTFRNELFYITHISNLSSILKHGILSHEAATRLEHLSVALEDVQNLREQKSFSNGLKLHQYANLYIDVRNPMMYRLKNKHKELCVLSIDLIVLNIEGVVVSNMNAACQDAKFYSYSKSLNKLDFDMIYAESWNSEDPETKKRHKAAKCAEVLVPYKVDANYICKIYVADEMAQTMIESIDSPLPIEMKPDMFFLSDFITFKLDL